jgi:hypothetical protein
MLGAGVLFVGYEAAIARYPYAYVKAIGYMAPLTSAFIAYGAIGLESALRPHLRKAARMAGIGALALVLLGSVLASRDMIRLWVENPGNPTFPRSYVALSALASTVPAGSSVLVNYPAPDYASLVKVGAIVYFLPDRSVRVFAANERIAFPDQNVMPAPCGFDYVISASSPTGAFSLIYSDPTAGLGVYKRVGGACTSG